MSFNPISGKFGAVLTGSSTYAFAKWKAAVKTNGVKVNNFTLAFQQLVAGLTSATVTLSGPYDGGNMPFTTGNAYTFILQFNNSLNFTVPVLLTGLDPEQDIDGAATVSLTGESTGSFTPSIA